MGRSLPLLPDGQFHDGAPLPRVCIATWEIAGPSRNAGIGTAYTSLAEALKRAGYEVTILYLLGSYCTDGNIVDWADYYRREKGIRLIALPLPPEPRLLAAWASSVSYHAYTWLKEHSAEFDIIHFPECQGLAFYSVVAKRQGLAFRNCTFVISAHGPTFWVKESSRDFIRNLGELEVDYMERVSVAAADVLTSPSNYLVEWMRRNAWELPPQVYLAPYVLPENIIMENGIPPRRDREVRELVFFGRLEIRKGLKLFCDAMDELCANSRRDFEVSFLGKETLLFGRSSIGYISDRSRKWSVPWRIISNRDQRSAMSYLKEPGRLAVMPSLVDNFPNAVLECVGAGIPFLASNSGGIPEIIAEEDRDLVCFEPQPAILANRLRDVLDAGGVQARPSFSFSDVERRWMNWHAGLVNQDNGKAPARHHKPSAQQESIFPLVSVCFAYDPRADGIEAAIASLKEQDYPRIEFILARYAGGKDDVTDVLAEAGADFRAERWHRIAVRNLEPGSARNAAVQEAKGEYVFFVDDHTTLLSATALSLFVQVAQRTGADIVTSTLSFMLGLAADRYEHSRRPFVGGDIASGAFANCYGSSNALIRRTAFDAVGGFSEDAASTLDDWEIFSKAALMGLKIESVPEPLIGYREDQEQESLVHSFVNAVRSVRPYTMPGRKVAAQIEPLLAKAVLLSQGLKFERDAATGTPLSRGEQGPAVTG